jgi:hypothetical protein
LKATNPQREIPPATRPADARRGVPVALAIVATIKLAGLAVDPALRFFLGDSGSYLHTALTGWIPPDRSFLYGWLIASTALEAQSAFALVALQTLFGVAGSMLLYAWLAFGVRVRPALAVAAAAVFALEPAQLFYERMMMAESTGLLAFVLFFACLSLYVASGRWRWIALYAAFGVLAVAMRISLLAVVLALSVLAPAVRALCVREPDRGRPLVAWLRFALHFALGVACTMYAHHYYKAWYGELAHSDPAYTARSGIFRLGLVVPLVKPEHFRNTGIPPAVLDEVTIPLADPGNREMHVWMQGGLIDAMNHYIPDPDHAARKVSIRAARSDPFGLVRMGLATLADYFDAEVADARLQDDIGRRAVHPSMIDELRRHLRYDATGMEQANTPATRWFAAGAPWLVACLFGLAPLALAALWLGRHGPRLELRVLLALASLGLVAGHVLFSHIVSYRYLHPLPWFVLANLALCAQAFYDRKTHRRELV